MALIEDNYRFPRRSGEAQGGLATHSSNSALSKEGANRGRVFIWCYTPQQSTRRLFFTNSLKHRNFQPSGITGLGMNRIVLRQNILLCTQRQTRRVQRCWFF
jgi:hypothetical protein